MAAGLAPGTCAERCSGPARRRRNLFRRAALTAPQAAIWFGLILGAAFGLLAEITGFCFRRTVSGPVAERRPALGLWLVAVVASLIGTQGAVAAGLISFEEHRFFAADLPVLAIIAGGLLFGAGMVLTRGCVSRLTVLTGTGNLRALLVLVVFAITAHATLKGVLAPLRVALGSVTVPLQSAGLSALPGGAWVWTALWPMRHARAFRRARRRWRCRSVCWRR